MSKGFRLNERFIAWSECDLVEGETSQEKEALNLISSWRKGNASFFATTSGSTGKPKTVSFERSRASFSAQSTINYFNLNPSDHALVCMDVSKIAGKMMIIRALISEMELTIVEPSRTPSWDGYTFTAVAPIQLDALLDQRIPSSYKCILVGGAPVSFKLAQKVSASGLPVYETFGMTETLSHVAVRKVSTVNEPFVLVQDVAIRLDERDCLALKGEITNGMWVQTNDRVEIVGADRFLWLGREDFTINSGGIKLQPENIETDIATVMDKEFPNMGYYIHGFPHEKYGSSPVLIIEGDIEQDTGSLVERLKALLPDYHAPRKVIFIPKFSYSSTGKLLRHDTAKLVGPFTF